jgi:hypothetical protein
MHQDIALQLLPAFIKDEKVKALTQLKYRPTPLLKLVTEKGQYIVRLNKRDGFFRKYLGSHAFAVQTAVYALLNKERFIYFRIPELVYTDYKNICISRYIEHEAQNIADINPEKLANGLLEFQMASASTSQFGWHGFLSYFIRKKENLVLNLIFKLSFKKSPDPIPAPIKRACTELALRCSEKEKNTPHAFLAHWDFHRENVLFGEDGHLYFIDFEFVRKQKKWLMTDIVRYAIDAISFEMNLSLIKIYMDKAKKHFPGLNYSVQLRLAMLWYTISLLYNHHTPIESRRKIKEFIAHTLLQNDAWTAWFDTHFEFSK